MPSRKAPKKTPAKPVGTIHVLHVELVSSQPRVWRELQVPSNMSLGKLHDVIQAALGWTNSHLHAFENRKRQRFGPSGDELDELEMLNEDDFTVADLGSRKGSAFGYIYDFGDDWVHRIDVVRVQPSEVGAKYPACTDGAGACPPEDSGGMYGWMEKLRILKNPKHPEYEELLEWLGGPVDPKAFDLKAANKAVYKVR